MSTPLGHSLAGYVIALFTCNAKITKSVSQVLLLIFIANFPDLDILPGIIVGKPNLFHHGISHSIGAAIILCSILTIILYIKNKQVSKKQIGVYFGLYSSHLVLDYLSKDGRPPAGIPVLWPFSQDYYISSYQIFPGVKHSNLDNATVSQFIGDIFSVHNFQLCLIESAVVIGCAIIYMTLKYGFKKI